MDIAFADWLNLALRWAHVITGIAWIGSSFYFMWLDAHLEKPAKPLDGVEGEIWMVHSGGFYQVHKINVAPKVMPKTLHWFVWEATFTWITGALLLALVYYLGARVFMVDPDVADILPGTAVAIGIGGVALAWFAYDALWASPLAKNREGLANIISLLALAGFAFGFSLVFSGRAAFIHTGALMGTIMAANVWRRIIPSQQGLVAAAKAGTTPDPQLGIKAKQRSVHNNYLTLPVIFTMTSAHYPMTFGHDFNWVILLTLFVIGAVVRHSFNLRNKGRKGAGWVAIGVSLAGFLALIVAASLPRTDTGQAQEGPVAFAAVQKIIARHCVSCHARKPSREDFDEAPKGVMLETPAQIKKWSAKIRKQSVDTKVMPLGNESKMTLAERALLGRWTKAGANIE
ncbi:MAG: urate hydroxylase PuuD [Alphaproteobacteria bacterium]